jgi:predicted amidophosphoribosyltransferase
VKKFILDLFFPKFCLGCKKEGEYLCEDCKSLLDISEYNYCLCDRAQRLPFNQKSGKCNRCSDKKLSGLYFALPYKENFLTKKLIYQFKYEPYLKDLSKTLASILVEYFVKAGINTNEIWENSVLIPVPLDKTKLKNRGYSQTEELAKELSKIINVPVFTDVLIKTKTTPPQMKLKKLEREKNLLDAFSINNSLATSDVATPSVHTGCVQRAPSGGTHPVCIKIAGKKVFLVDDVYTTGSTMQECAKVLKQSGAKQVWGICIARES